MSVIEMGGEVTLEVLRERGFELHERGELGAAERAYRTVLERDAGDHEVMHALGVLAVQSGRYAVALELIGGVLRVRQTGALYGDMGNALLGLGRLEEAIGSYERAVSLEPALGSAHLNCGHALRALGRGAQALLSYERAIAAWPQLAPAHESRAVLLVEMGRWEEGLSAVEQALGLGSDTAALHTLRGMCCVGLGRSDEALLSYGRALECGAGYAPAHINRGVLLRGLGRAAEALESFDAVLASEPRSVEALSNRAAALTDLKRYGEALEAAERALEIEPQRAEPQQNRAAALMGLNRHEAALVSYEALLAHNGTDAQLHVACATALQHLHRHAEALASCERALELDGGNADAHFNRGVALEALGSMAEALGAYERAIELDAGHAEAHCNRGNVLKGLDRLEAALLSYERAIAVRPEYAEAHSNCGNVLRELNRVQASRASHDRAVELEPQLAEARFNRAAVLLLSGDYAAGWADYEWRWRLGRRSSFHERAPPGGGELWLGERSLAGKTILLYGEQGLGDTLQFCRYASLVAQLGARVILQVQEPLQGLLGGLAGVERVLGREEAVPGYDVHCPLMSLPLAFGTRVETIPGDVPYLRADESKVGYWRGKLKERSGKVRVGLVWSGGFRPNQPELWSVNERRNVGLRRLSGLRQEGVEYYSLQKGEPASLELGELERAGWGGPGVIDHTGELLDFSDTAALIEELDLVISVDTATAHLAGALGKAVWVMNRYDTCWRWFLERDDSPWYPTLRLYRQERRGDWDGVLQRINADLERLSAASQTHHAE